MIFRLRFFVISAALLFVGFIGWRGYVYFFDTTDPIIALIGVDSDHYYAGDMQCALSSSKSGEVSIWLDDQPLVANYRISAGQSGHPFTIPTKTIANGKHMLKALVTYCTYKKKNTKI